MLFLIALTGVAVSWFIQEGLSLRFVSVTTGSLEGFLVLSGLSLALLSVCPFGGLTPRLGRVLIFSRLGYV